MQQEELNKRIDQAVQGDRLALEEVLTEIQDMVFNLSLRMLGTIADAQDAAQEILIKVMTSISTFRKESRFQTWVYRIAVNYLMDVKRSMFAAHPLDFDFYANDLRASYVPDEEEALTGCTREEAARELKLSCTNVMLQCLKPQDRCIYILGTMFHIDSKSAAEILDMTPEAYRQRLSRARKRMASFLSTYCGAVSNGFCQCDKRIPYAVMTHRLEPQNLEYSRLKTLDKRILNEFCDHMEELEEIMDSFDQLPAFRCTMDAKQLLRELVDSEVMKKVQNAKEVT